MKKILLLLLISGAVYAQNETITQPDWYKTGTIYNLDIKTFQDSDNDGIGDINGLISRLGYIDSLGFDIIWLSPFQPSPLKDDGYDVSDFYQVDQRLGTLDDFKNLVQECNQRKIRLLLDLVINHTSSDHPWFQEARKNKNSPYHDWYVWSDKKPLNYNVGMVFPGSQEAIWDYDSVAGKYYYHRFYKFQPDLNSQNENVKKEIKKVIKHWLELGLSGFRLDAVPFYIEVPAVTGDNFERKYDMITDLRRFTDSLNKDAIVLGEVNVTPKENKDYFGEHGEGMKMMFNFFVNQRLFYAFATENTRELKSALKQTRVIPEDSRWAQFLRNHDELDLGRLSREQREEVLDKFAPEQSMRLYNRGIRRRLAPMFSNDIKQLKFAYNVLFSLPNTPVVRYGEETGMGDYPALPEREAVRTPMQWNGLKNAGFSTADSTFRPVIQSDTFGYKKVNVDSEFSDPQSLLHAVKKFIAARNSLPQLSLGFWELVELPYTSVLAIRYEYQGKNLLVVHNFSREAQKVKLPGKFKGKSLQDVFNSEKVNTAPLHLSFQLEGLGSRWFVY